MYKSELKQLDDQFENNGTTYIMPGLDISQHLLSMNSYLADIDELLSDAGLEAIDHHDFTKITTRSTKMNRREGPISQLHQTKQNHGR